MHDLVRISGILPGVLGAYDTWARLTMNLRGMQSRKAFWLGRFGLGSSGMGWVALLLVWAYGCNFSVFQSTKLCVGIVFYTEIWEIYMRSLELQNTMKATRWNTP